MADILSVFEHNTSELKILHAENEYIVNKAGQLYRLGKNGAPTVQAEAIEAEAVIKTLTGELEKNGGKLAAPVKAVAKDAIESIKTNKNYNLGAEDLVKKIDATLSAKEGFFARTFKVTSEFKAKAIEAAGADAEKLAKAEKIVVGAVRPMRVGGAIVGLGAIAWAGVAATGNRGPAENAQKVASQEPQVAAGRGAA